MSEQAIALSQQEWLAPSAVVQRVRAIQQLMEAVMKDNTHYGIIPGTKKPTLYKAGSEQILSMFQISVDPIIEDLSTPDEARFRVLCRLTDKTGRFLGAGIGEASSNEAKYKWRSTVSRAEWEWYQKNSPDRSRIKFEAYWNDGKRVESQKEQIRTEVADVANTILKMAKKRAQIDATLTVTGCSDMFQQDLDDLPPELVDEMNQDTDRPAPKEPVKPTTKKATPKQAEGEAIPPAGAVCSDAQVKRLIAIQSTMKMSDDVLKAYMLKEFGITSRKLIPKSQAYTYGVYESLVDFIDPKFTVHTDDFEGHEIGKSKHKNSNGKKDEEW